MAYPTLYEPSRRFFDLPEIISPEGFSYPAHAPQKIPSPVAVLFLVKTTQAQRDELLRKLQDANNPWLEAVVPRPLAAVPWLRNFTPDVGVVFALAKYHCDAHIFVDARGLHDETCIVSQSPDWSGHQEGGLHRYDHEFARVELARARLLVSAATRDVSWFPGTLHEGQRFRETEAVTPSAEWEFVGRSVAYKWPGHLPTDLKLEAARPTIISMIYLSSEEMAQFEAALGVGAENKSVDIINWPADIEPATEVDMWHIFDAVRPHFVDTFGEVFGFFIDTFDLSAPLRDLKLLAVTRARSEQSDFRIDNSMDVVPIRKDRFFAAWDTAFNPAGRDTTDGVRCNDAMRALGLGTEQNGYGFGPRTNGRSSFANMTNPDVPLLLDGTCSLTVFFLQPVTGSQEHQLRALFSGWEACQFIRVPAGDGAVSSLIKYFQSPDYTCHVEKPPADFVAIDALTLSALAGYNWDEELRVYKGKPPSVLLGTTANVFHQDENGTEIAEDSVGYVVGRSAVHDGECYESWANSSRDCMGLMSFIEDGADEDQTGTGRYYWDCFDVGSEELEQLVVTRE